MKAGCAAFLIQSNGKYVGKPVRLAIPQYAFHIEEGTGKRTPVVVIQAEEDRSIKAVGFKVVGSEQLGVALINELQLLGMQPPR